MKLPYACLAVASASAALLPPQSRRCVQSIVPIRISATNFDLGAVDPTQPAQPNQTVPVSGIFNVEVHFCEPTTQRTAHGNTLLVTAPGATYNTLYWDLPFQPETYSFVRYANSQGYTTLNIARVGNGLSSWPDPVNMLQMPLQVAAQIQILKLARAGAIPGMRGRGFRSLVGIGHSLSSVLLNGVIIEAPQLLQAAIFTGYAHNVATLDPPRDTTGFAFIPASQSPNPLFANLPGDYVTTENITSRSFFYGPPGTFDPVVLEFDEAHKDTVSTGEMNTIFAVALPAPDFRGDVFTVNGGLDVGYCATQECELIELESQFYPNARSVESAIIEDSGHGLTLHRSAPQFSKTVISWLERHGY